MTSYLQACPTGKQWEKIGIQKHHGINLPLFSLRSEKSCGIGEYPDLLPLIDWCQSLGLDTIQLLPLNDGGPEPSPYSALSAFALNPLYLGLSKLPFLDQLEKSEEFFSDLLKLNNLQRISYQAVQAKREAFLRAYFKAVGHLLTQLPEYPFFVKSNPWLENFALFKAIKIDTQWTSWENWPPSIRDPSSQNYQELLEKYRDEMTYHSVLQFLCFQQMNEVKQKAESRKIFLKGDIPILINRDSAEVWRNRSFYFLDFAAGAPPDVFSAEGQKWGFPIYDWKSLEEQGYSLWKERLRVAENLYHLYRLDHIIGFFRIWAIPIQKSAKEGYYLPPNPVDWVPQGEKILRMMLASCSLLPIGEDLGVVPPSVRESLSTLGICGTKVMRWERMWDEDKRFIKIEDYAPVSMTTVSTHDSETLQMWWKNQQDEAKDYAQFKGWNYSPELQWDQRRQILWDSHHTSSLFHINLLQEYLALIPEMTWIEPDDERINVPGTFSDRNWSYRFRPSVEEIISNNQLADCIRSLIRL